MILPVSKERSHKMTHCCNFCFLPCVVCFQNNDVPPLLEKIAAAYGATPCDGVLSHRLKQYIIDGNECILMKPSPERRVWLLVFVLFRLLLFCVLFIPLSSCNILSVSCGFVIGNKHTWQSTGPVLQFFIEQILTPLFISCIWTSCLPPLPKPPP